MVVGWQQQGDNASPASQEASLFTIAMSGGRVPYSVADRLMYGSDFPNIPFAWDRELKCLGDAVLSEANLNKNATAFFDLDPIA